MIDRYGIELLARHEKKKPAALLIGKAQDWTVYFKRSSVGAFLRTDEAREVECR